MTSAVVGLVFLATLATIAGLHRRRGNRLRADRSRENAYWTTVDILRARVRFVEWQFQSERAFRLVITRQRDVLQAIADRRMRDVADAAAERLAEPATLRAVPDVGRRTRTRKKVAG